MSTARAPGLPDSVLGRRIGGALIDVLVMAALLYPVGALFGQASAHSGQISVHLDGAGLTGFVGVVVLYFTVLELAIGASLGKLLVGVRVAAETLERPSPWRVIVRNLLRPIDILPAFYLLGYLVMMASGPDRRQRLGDRVARTLVVPRAAVRPASGSAPTA